MLLSVLIGLAYQIYSMISTGKKKAVGAKKRRSKLFPRIYPPKNNL